MKIIFMGTPQFAVPALEMLAGTTHQIGYVFTQPDKAKDRGKKIQYTPVKEKAVAMGIPVLQPERIKGNEEILTILKQYAPDLIVVAAYGQLLPKEVLEIPRLGCINIHGSLLPKLRGAAPIQRAILEGEERTGITLMNMEEGLDTGAMLAKRETPIDGKTLQELYDELSILGGALLLDKLDEIQAGTIVPVPQDDSQATYARMIYKKDGHIDFKKPAVEIERLIRGLNPLPGAFAEYQEGVMKIFKAHVAEPNPEAVSREPGTITEVHKGGIQIATGDKDLIITEIQMPNKKRMSVEDFLKGHRIQAGSQLR